MDQSQLEEGVEACTSINGDERREEIAQSSGHNHLCFGEPPDHQNHPGIQTNFDGRTALNSSGDGDGCPQACLNMLPRKGLNHQDVSEDRMDLEAGSGFTTTV